MTTSEKHYSEVFSSFDQFGFTDFISFEHKTLRAGETPGLKTKKRR